MDKALGSLPSTTTWGWGWGYMNRLTGAGESPKTTNQIHLVLPKLPCSQLEQEGTPPLHLIRQHAEIGLLAQPKINDALNGWLKNSLGSLQKRERA